MNTAFKISSNAFVILALFIFSISINLARKTLSANHSLPPTGNNCCFCISKPTTTSDQRYTASKISFGVVIKLGDGLVFIYHPSNLLYKV